MKEPINLRQTRRAVLLRTDRGDDRRHPKINVPRQARLGWRAVIREEPQRGIKNHESLLRPLHRCSDSHGRSDADNVKQERKHYPYGPKETAFGFRAVCSGMGGVAKYRGHAATVAGPSMPGKGSTQ